MVSDWSAVDLCFAIAILQEREELREEGRCRRRERKEKRRMLGFKVKVNSKNK